MQFGSMRLHFCNTQYDWWEGHSQPLHLSNGFSKPLLTVILTLLCHPSSNTSIAHNANPRQKSKQTCSHSCCHNHANMPWILEETIHKPELKLFAHWYITNSGQSWKRNLEELKRHLCFPANYISLACTSHKHFILECGSKTCPKITALNTATSNAFL